MNLFDFASDEARRQGLDPALVRKVISAESSGNPNAVSAKGARGPMQLMPGTARDMGVDPSDPMDNIRGGVRYLKQQMDTFGTPELALAAYNAGPGAVRKYGGVPPYAETQGYVSKITGGSMDGFDGSDIFGVPHAAAAPKGGSFDGADIFSSAPPAPKPAAPPAGPPVVAAQSPSQPMRKDQMLGLEKGLNTPIDNAAMALETGLQHIGVPTDRINRALGMPSAVSVADRHAADYRSALAQGRKPGGIGEFVGNVAGTIPAAMATTNPFVAGALSGALLTDARDPTGVLTDAGVGAATGGIASGAMGLVGRALKGGDKAVQKLIASGVNLTPGKVLGGVAQRIEDKLVSVPFVGDVIAGRQAALVPQLNTAAANEVLGSIGKKVPAGTEVGHDTVAYVGKTISDSYDNLLKPLTVRLDPQFAADMNKLAPSIASLAPADQAQVQAILKHEVSRRLGAGPVKGEDLKGVESYLTSTISGFYKNPNKAEMADVLWDVQQAFRDMLARQNPAAAEALKAHNLAYAKLIRLENAAAGAVDGVASPAQLKQAVVRGAGRRNAAQGQGLMQDLANAGAKVIPGKVGNSGTADRALAVTLPGLVAAGVTAPALPLYSTAGQQLVQRAFGTSRPVVAKAAGDLLTNLKTPALVGSSALVVGGRKKPGDASAKR